MTVYTHACTLLSEGSGHAQLVTDQVRAAVSASSVSSGVAHVFYRHTTGALLIVEYEAGILADLEDTLEAIAPAAAAYLHHRRGYDENGAAHLRTALLSVSVAVPVIDGELALGSWQEILAVDFDPGLKTRSLLVQVMGE